MKEYCRVVCRFLLENYVPFTPMFNIFSVIDKPRVLSLIHIFVSTLQIRAVCKKLFDSV